MKEDEPKSVEVIYKYFLPEHESELKMHKLAVDFFSALWEIHSECRTVLKHGPRAAEGVEEFAERINGICYESGMREIE